MNSVDVNLDGLSVFMAMPTTRDLPAQTAMSLWQTAIGCTKIALPCHPHLLTGCAIITKARSELVHDFLQSDCNRLFWVDSDIVWKFTDFMRLVALSRIVDVVGATYPAKIDGDVTSYFVKYDASRELVPVNEYGLLDVQGMGLGFTVMRREVVEDIVNRCGTFHDQVTGKYIPDVFRCDTTEEGYFRGEDMAFFADVMGCGYKVWLDPDTDLGHCGSKVYSGTFRTAFSQSTDAMEPCGSAS